MCRYWCISYVNHLVKGYEMKIIDFDKKGNVVRFYFGNDYCDDYHGDDWNDYPYEHNSGIVYDDYIEGWLDIAFPFDYNILDPASDWHYDRNSPYCKNDFKACKAPCIVAIKEDKTGFGEDSYSIALGDKNSTKIYFNDDVDETAEICEAFCGATATITYKDEVDE